MASMQVTRSRAKETATATKSVVTPKQSQELLQIMILGAISNLAIARDLFPSKAIHEQIINGEDKVFSYADFAGCKLEKQFSAATKPRTRTPVLRRGFSRRVDSFLNMLEKGIYPLLEARNLKVVQIFIHPGDGDRSKVLECYTLKIKYKDAEDGRENLVEALDVESGGNVMVTASLAKKKLGLFMREVDSKCKNLPRLPGQKFISISLESVTKLTRDLFPAGFMEKTADTLTFAQALGYSRSATSFRSLDFGFHDGSLVVSHLEKQALTLSQKALAKRLPTVLTYASSAIETVMPSTVGETPQIHQAKPDRGMDRGASRNHSSARRTIASKEEKRPDTGQFQIPATQSQRSAKGETQTTEVKAIGRAVRAMQWPEQLTQGDTQPQRAVYARSEDLNEDVSTVVDSPKRKAANGVGEAVKKLVLRHGTMEGVRANKATLKVAAQAEAMKNGLQDKDGEFILCECECGAGESELIACDICDTWQHVCCYGYLGSTDARIPAEHVCYRCLLGGKEGSIMMHLRRLALRRRCMKHALDHGLRHQTTVAAELGCNQTKITLEHRKLRDAGYVIPSEGGSGPRYVAVTKGPSFEKMQRDLFDPYKLIEHHFTDPAKFVDDTSHNYHVSGGDAVESIDSPATSDLDGTAWPRLQQSTLARVHPRKTPKRPRNGDGDDDDDDDGDDDVATAAKRVATPFSARSRYGDLQSQFVFDATTASSPAPVFGRGSRMI